jgi:hypothetical protein
VKSGSMWGRVCWTDPKFICIALHATKSFLKLTPSVS